MNRITTENLTGNIQEVDDFYGMQNFNTVLISGRLATEPEVKTFDNGAHLLRFLVTTRTENPGRRVDVLPVSVYLTVGEEVPTDLGSRGAMFHAEASVQRRFWESPDGRRSRMELVAEEVTISTMALEAETAEV